MNRALAFLLLLSLFAPVSANGEAPPVSEATQDCLGCHETVTPGIVADWRKSRHAATTPNNALKGPEAGRRISAKAGAGPADNAAVGCAECHTRLPGKHADTFEHNGYNIHIVVSPEDCAGCHPVEREQYRENLMANAYGNLKNNELYQALVFSINSVKSFDGVEWRHKSPSAKDEAGSCLFCHGTKVEVGGKETRKTALGEMDFPILSGWPNQGVGRINPDGSKGSCASCHARHRFSIEMARRPYTCSECHKGPDVPAYPVYEVSKHGNIFSSDGKTWDWKAVPWTLGKDFTAPTCAACHASMIVAPNGDLVAERTHRMNDRSSLRIFGLPYAHAHPISGDTSGIRNGAGLPLPTELTGEPVAKALIDAKEQARRRAAMERICRGCHSSSWVKGHFEMLEDTVRSSNEMTRSATQILLTAWEKGAARGPAQKDSPFNEPIEKMWVEQWLFHANSTRFAAAMSGADYGVFANGRWHLSKNLREMEELLRVLLKTKEK